jgi:putative phage-type endonuclease
MDNLLLKYQNKVKYLMKKNKKCPPQRSPEWFKARNTRITASEAASCLFKSKNVCEIYANQFNIRNFKYKDTEPLNHYETKEDYIIKKCSAFYGENVFKDSVFTLWGKKYEEVANRLYCQLNNTNVIEFGLVSHPRLNWLAASPDGITPNGIMLEIKCPKSRKIDETQVPIHYWVQTQIQLETCDLDFCDFFECEIDELQSEEQFINQNLNDKQAKGIILQIQNSDCEPKYIYPPIHIISTQEYIDWKNNTIIQEQQSHSYPVIPIYYFIKKYNNQRVERSKTWFENVKNDIKNTWKIIINLQQDLENFQKYKESIHLIRSKNFYERFHTTTCEIEDDTSTFIFEKTSESESINTIKDLEESTEKETICLID